MISDRVCIGSANGHSSAHPVSSPPTPQDLPRPGSCPGSELPRRRSIATHGLAPPDPRQEGERQQPATTAGADADPTVLALATAIGLLALGIGPLITA
jgi:hypothetical protein